MLISILLTRGIITFHQEKIIQMQFLYKKLAKELLCLSTFQMLLPPPIIHEYFENISQYLHKQSKVSNL